MGKVERSKRSSKTLLTYAASLCGRTILEYLVVASKVGEMRKQEAIIVQQKLGTVHTGRVLPNAQCKARGR